MYITIINETNIIKIINKMIWKWNENYVNAKCLKKSNLNILSGANWIIIFI